MVTEILVPAGASAEAVVAYPGTKDAEILFDQGAAFNGVACKDSMPANRAFNDVILHVE